MKILFLSTWFPYPPNQGSKIRAYHLLRALARHHEIWLLSFEDVELKPDWLEHIQRMCINVQIVPRDPFLADSQKTRMGWFTKRPSAAIAIYSQEMERLAVEVANNWQPDCVVALTFVTAPYALQIDGIPKVLDVDNLMTRMLYEAYRMESRTLGRLRRWLAYKKFENYEKWMCPRFDRNLVVTDEDLVALAAMIHSDEQSIKVVANGVDTTYYQPYTGQRYANTLVYNGALTYQANFDAMDYFLRDIFPLIIEQIPDVKLQITGRTNGVEIDKLPLYSRVEFTGYLDDIRPTVAKSCACVIPLRVGGGTRLKVLEAMALGTPVISTTKGAEGLDLRSDDHLMIADTPQEFASQTVRILQNPQIGDRLSQNAAKWVKERYDWGSIGLYFRQVVEELVE